MNKILNEFIISFLVLLFSISFNTYLNIHPFNENNVIKDIDFLTSNNFKGRLTGTFENKLIEEYIRLQFIKNDLKPFIGDYTQPFTTNYPKRINGYPHLIIQNDAGVKIKEFIYGIDYKEDMLNFKNNKIIVNNKNPFIISKDRMLQVEDNKDYFLFYIPTNDNLNFRSSFVNDSNWSMCVMVTKETLSSINTAIRNGNSVDCFIPFSNSTTTASNILGFIEGKNKYKDPIIISAHFDHLGADLNNNIYKGALDNASGTSFMLEMMRYISSLGRPDRSILFVGFNAEEFGCIGSDNFVKTYKPYIKNSKVFNFDMIGSNQDIPLCLMGGKQDSKNTKFIKNISTVYSSQNININYLFEDNSDHKAFRDNNIDAITFCDNDTSRIHTLKDNPKFIKINSISRCFNFSNKKILEFCFNNNFMIIYYKQILYLSLFFIVIFLILICLHKNYNH
ncbi:M28 family metallopeptidase [Clostridium botulinum]|uniref:M28 family metallopeptidase n=1 Tax=Clostridium botulinum TaxID=1491 RepID=UPI001E62EAD2|nr:M28 family metallopeptidase [Clostridium botulinum]MCD3337099.1 Zn-dependent exopeptidase M28 [Clostridium botulinum D/C]